jgi:hypothetical protein
MPRKNSGVSTIAANARAKKVAEEKKKHKNKLHHDDGFSPKVKKKSAHKIRQTFVDDGDFTYSKILVIRLINQNNDILEECTRKHEIDITRNKYHRIGEYVIFKENLLTRIVGIITTEKNLVYLVREVDKIEKDKYLAIFGKIEPSNVLDAEIKYIKTKK